MDYDHQEQETCEICGHPMGHYDGGLPMHVRKGIEYSVTCFQCPCRTACERTNDIRAKEKPPERVSVLNYVQDRKDPAGSVVTKNVPEREIWAGNPAHKIKSIISYPERLEIEART